MMHLYGIGQRVKFVMIPFSLHLALMMQLEMRLVEERVMLGAQIWWNSKVALGSLMAHSSTFKNLRMMEPTSLVQWVRKYLFNEQHHGC
jgi:hypothetical protein